VAEFTIGEHRYRNRKMNVRQQLHVVRRLAPVMGPLVRFAELQTIQPTDSPSEALERQMEIVVPFFEAFARMPDDDVNYVLNTCMSMTQRQQGGNGSGPQMWVDVWNPQAGREMFDDIDMPTAMQICWNVIQDNLSGFSLTRQAQPDALNIPPQHPAGFSG
jgi:hypothetical protein